MRTGSRPIRWSVTSSDLEQLLAEVEDILTYTTEDGDEATIYGVRLYAKD